PTWADNNFWGSPAAAVYEDTTPPDDPPSNPLDGGLTAGDHDHSHDDEDIDPADVQPRITVAQEDAERRQHLGKQHFRAEIHSHTAISDGVQMHIDAMEHVAETANVDFFGVTDHDVVFDLRNADAFAEDRHNSHSEEWKYSHETAEKFNEQSDHL